MEKMSILSASFVILACCANAKPVSKTSIDAPVEQKQAQIQIPPPLQLQPPPVKSPFELFLFQQSKNQPEPEVKKESCRPEHGARCVPVFELKGDMVDDTSKKLERFFEAWKDEKVHTFVIRINSRGGSIDAGFAIHDMIVDQERERGIKIHCVVDGNAHSSAFFVLQSCGVRVMGQLSKLSTHNPFFVMSGNMKFTHTELQALAEDLLNSVEVFAEVISTRMGISREKYLSHINGRDWDFNAESAKKYRAIDIVALTYATYLANLRSPPMSPVVK